MMKYDKLSLIRSVQYFNDYEQDDKDTSLLYLGEELVRNAERLDKFLSDEDGGFDQDNDKHVKLFAKIDQLNEELESLLG